MTARVTRWMLLGLIGTTLLVGAHSSAWASHYRLEVLEVFTPEQVEALRGAGLETTEDYLRQSQTQAERQALSQQTGISELEVLIFARLCELLQIEGVGPRAAQLLRAAGVSSVQDLAGRDANELVSRVAAVNAVEQLTGIDPTLENLTDWIQSAGGVPYHVQ